MNTGVLFIAFVILQFYNGPYKRLGNEALKTHLIDAEGGAGGFGDSVMNPALQASAGESLLMLYIVLRFVYHYFALLSQ